MLGNKENVLELEFVYKENKTEEFKNLHITANIPNDILVISIESEEPVMEEDLGPIICSLQKNNFNKLRLNIFEECEIFLVYAGNSVRINPAKISEICALSNNL